MTRKKDFKQIVRARMERTGESYTAARAALLGDLARHQPFRARHDQTAALRRLLAAAGARNPHTGQPFDEAWLLGLGGGISAQYFVFEYAGHPPILYVGTRCNPQYAYTPDFIVRACERIGLAAQIEETTGAKKALANLRSAVRHGPVIAWVGQEALSEQPQAMGATPWVVVVHDIEGDRVAIEDARLGSLERSVDAFLAAQRALRKAKHRLLRIDGQPTSDLRDGVRAGIASCLDDLAGRTAVGGFAKNFGLQALSKWAGLVTSKSKRGWPAVFAPGAHLLHGLAQLYRWVERATGGGGFRPMYADFLAGAAGACISPGPGEEAARAYRDLGAQWSALATEPLRAGPPVLGDLHRTLTRAGAWPERAELEPLAERAEKELRGAAAERIYADLAARLDALEEGERRAAELLERALP